MPRFFDNEVRDSDGEHLEVFASELGGHGEVVVVCPLGVLDMECRYWRVVRNLGKEGQVGGWQSGAFGR